MPKLFVRIFSAAAAAWLACAVPCGAQLMYYDYDNSRFHSTNNFKVQNIINAGSELRAPNVYTSGWFRNYNAQQGLFAQAYSAYFYPSSANEWTQAGGGTYQQMLFRDTAGGTLRGYLYSNGSGFGFLGSQGWWVLYAPYGSNRLNLPSTSGMQLGIGNTITSSPASYGTISFQTAKNGWYGLLMGQDSAKDIFMCDGSANCGLYNESNGWQNYWDKAGSVWTIYGTFRTESGYPLQSGGKRVLTKVVVTEMAAGYDNVCTAPSCPSGSSDITGNLTSSYMCWRNCVFGNNSGWGSLP